MNNKVKKENESDTQSMIIFAFRYALGRDTYAVGIVCDWIRTHYISKNKMK